MYRADELASHDDQCLIRALQALEALDAFEGLRALEALYKTISLRPSIRPLRGL